ncbi:MAG: HAMP domain-containing sensor histidine kinase [Rhodothermales bacterium]
MADPAPSSLSGFIPRRASTQTWMLLTFVLFIGIGIVAVVFYLGVLQNEAQRASQNYLRAEAEALSTELASEPDSLQRVIVKRLGRITGMHVTVLRNGQLFAQELPIDTAPAEDWTGWKELGVSAEEPVRYANRTVNGETIRYVALHVAPNQIIHIGEPETSADNLAQQMRIALIVSMILALLLAMAGSWVASQKIIAPLKDIRDRARRISDGDFDQAIAVSSRASEFQDLAKSLNQMSSRYRDKIDELQRLTQMQNEFIGNISHEVRNPIFSVGGYLEALSSASLKPESRQRYAQKALANLERLTNLFNDLIEIARLEYRDDLLKSTTFDMQELVDDLGDMLTQKAERKSLVLEYDNPPVMVDADRNRMRQVMLNLIDNAIAYTDEGSVRVRTRRHVDKVRIEIIDTGKGIAPEHIERIFERFYRVDPDRSRKSGGTGLGLSIVKQILHAHGEQIHVESTAGRGTRFWFELPFAEAEVVA